jgi:poly-beta-1,6-N-acetyl-D-glucosamine biosynthesis protein PgaD
VLKANGIVPTEDFRPSIIDKPEYKSPLKRLVEGSITAVLWLLWVYWILPLITIFMWIFGINIFIEGLFTGDILGEVRVILFNGGIAIILVLIIQLVWINYNFRMIFKKRGERRAYPQATTNEEFAEYFNVPIEDLINAKNHRRIDVMIRNERITLSDHDVLIKNGNGGVETDFHLAYKRPFFPSEFMASALTSEMAHPGRLKFLLKECRRMNIMVLPPDLIESEFEYISKKGKIITGFGTIKGVDRSIVREIKAKRSDYREARTIQDICEVSNFQILTKNIFTKLIKAGAVDNLEGNRKNKLNRIREFYK